MFFHNLDTREDHVGPISHNIFFKAHNGVIGHPTRVLSDGVRHQWLSVFGYQYVIRPPNIGRRKHDSHKPPVQETIVDIPCQQSSDINNHNLTTVHYISTVFTTNYNWP